LEPSFVNNLKTTSSRLLRKELLDELKRLSQAPLLILLCGGATVDPEAIHRATGQSTVRVAPLITTR
jgi:hypothetical protein